MLFRHLRETKDTFAFLLLVWFCNLMASDLSPEPLGVFFVLFMVEKNGHFVQCTVRPPLRPGPDPPLVLGTEVTDIY